MKKLLIVVGALALLFLAIEYSRSDFRAFQARREAWHLKCDAYMGQHATRSDPEIRDDCQRELDELVAYAERKGWTK